MKYIALIIALSLSLFSCKENKDKKTSPKENIHTIDKVDPKTGWKMTISYIVKDKDSILQGLTRVYNKPGKVIGEFNYKNDKLDGLYRTFYDNGQPKEIERFSNGLKNGKCIYYHENGNLDFIVEYKHDILCSDAVYYYPNGKMEQYALNDCNNGAAIKIKFDKKGNINSLDGKTTNCFYNDTIKFGEKLKIDCMIANIPNTRRSIQYVYSDLSKGSRTTEKHGKNHIEINELKYKKGENLLYVVTNYKFDRKYYNQVLTDTVPVTYYVQ